MALLVANPTQKILVVSTAAVVEVFDHSETLFLFRSLLVKVDRKQYLQTVD